MVGAPTSVGQCKSGVELGPNALRAAGLIKQLQHLGHNVVDFGDIPHQSINTNQNSVNNKLKNVSEVQEMCSQLYSLVEKVVLDKRIPITLGGDHSIAMASISGNAGVVPNDELCVVWVDAHADINTVATTRTGHFHGMPASFLINQIQHHFNNPNNNCIQDCETSSRVK
ncbi:unnamed protein product [Oppiella nova]|uniref:Arginase n=1 Tax=Oppiella nova TaxID=334625 RepID=A0A7R9QKQ2_9ACAR|nr:unnamed protein product [Oppiella nova]CAG2167807.1 unnamed protein product [Oppiella nova]